MTNLLDNHPIELTCPNCAHKLRKTIGQLKSQTNTACPACRASIKLDKAQMAREIAKFDQAAAQLGRALGRLGK